MNVVFVAPYLMRATLQFITGAATLPGVRLTLLTQDSQQSVPDALKPHLHHLFRAPDLMNTGALEAEIRQIIKVTGPVDRLLGTLEHIQINLAEVRDRLKIPGVDAETARNFRDKSRMKDVLGKHGLPCARHCLAKSVDEAVRFAREIGFPIIAKPPDGAGSRNTHRIQQANELESLLRQWQPTSTHPVLLEEFIRADEYTFESVRLNGKLVWHSITRYFPSPLEVLENPWIQWCIILPREVDHPAFNDIVSIADKAIGALGLQTGLSHLEWFRRKDGTIAISEVGARPPGGQLSSMTGYAHDFDFHQGWAEAAIFGTFQKPQRRYATGTVFMRGQGKGRVTTIDGLDKIHKELGSLIVETKLPQPGQPVSGTYEGEGYIILRHPQTSVIEHALDFILNTIRVRLG